MITHMKYKHLFTFGSAMIVAWVFGTFLFIYFWPHIMYNHYEKAILVEGFGDGPIPVNTLYAEPLASQSDSSSNLMTTGVNRDTLLTVGWLDLSKGPQVLHVPDMAGRYYSVQFTDRSDGTDFAYVGTRTTGTQAGDYLITGQGWKGTVPSGMPHAAKRQSTPNNSMLVIGRVLVYSDSDLPTAYGLAKLIQLAALSSK